MKKYKKNTQYKARRTIILIGVILLVNLFLMNFASAELFKFDNIKTYDSVKQEITIVNTFGIGADISKIQLITPKYYNVSVGKDVLIAQIKINSLEDYNAFFENMKSYNLRDGNKETSIIYNYKIKVNSSFTYTDLKGEKHNTYVDVWDEVDINKINLIKGQTLEIGIYTDTKDGDLIEWIPSLYGKDITEWGIYSAVGGTVTIDGLYTVHTFLTNGTFNWTGQDTNATVLIVGGGGGGGGAGYNHGGGGAGGLIYNQSYLLIAGFYNITVGVGGNGSVTTGTNGATGGKGQNSTIQAVNPANTLRAMGGGGGGAYNSFGTSGGSGGGSGGTGQLPQSGYPGQGFNGSGAGGNAGGSGGGSAMNSYNISTKNQAGGNGTLINITNGTGIYYAGGGGGGNGVTGGDNVTLKGGLGGGGNGGIVGIPNRSGVSGVPNTGGGGGGCAEPVGLYGGNGGSGIVIIRYLTSALQPSIILNSPVNYFNTSISLLTFNATVLDLVPGGGITNVSLLLNGVVDSINTTGGNGTYIFTKVLGAGVYNWSILAWNMNNTFNQSETRTFNLTIESPKITLDFPYPFYNTTNTLVNFTTTVTDNLQIKNVSLFVDAVLNVFDTSQINGTYNFHLNITQGLHNWSVYAYDNDSNPSQSLTRYFTIDYALPIINISFPINGYTNYISYSNVNSFNTSILWTVSDILGNLDTCFLTNLSSGLNITGTCNNLNITFYNLPYGTYIFKTYVNDTAGNYNSLFSQATYKYKLFEINQSYNNPVLENTPQDYYASIYLDSSLNINSVYFTYNGTNYSAGYSNIGNYTKLREIGFYSPNVNGNSNSTITWWVNLNDSSSINLSTQLQQVNNLIYSPVCNSTYPYYLFNFTLQDEKTQANINGTIETDIRFKSLNGSNLFNWTSNILNTSTFLCSSLPISSGNNYIVNGTVKYYASNENYSAMVEYYNFLNYSYNNNTYYTNISLYDINVTEGTEFQLTFKDSTFRAREDILIYVYRQYIPEGTFKIVELPKTDSNGQTVLHLVRNDVLYNLIAVDSNGNVLGTLNNVIAFCNDFTIGDCKINFQGTTIETDLENFIKDLGLTYTLSFNPTTNIISFVFSSTTTEIKNMRLEVISSAVVTNRTICDTSLSGITGTITCDVSLIVNSSSSVNAKIYLNNDEIINESMSLDNSNWNVPGILFFGFLLILIIGIMFMESKEGLVIAVIIGFIVLVGLGIAKGKVIGFTSGILWLIIVGIIILVKLNKENKG